jgi:hypothetical protein
VIASTAPAIMEVRGDAALHFHPDDAMTLRDLMQRVLDNPEVAGRMRTKGRCRPDIYQWTPPLLFLYEAYRTWSRLRRGQRSQAQDTSTKKAARRG